MTPSLSFERKGREQYFFCLHNDNPGTKQHLRIILSRDNYPLEIDIGAANF